MKTYSAQLDPLTIEDVVGVIRRRWLIGVTTLLVVAAICTFAVSLMTPLFESNADIMLSAPIVGTISRSPDAEDTQQIGQEKDEVANLNSQSDILISAPVLERVLLKSDLTKGPSYHHLGSDLSMLSRRVRVKVGLESNTVNIGLRDESAERAQSALSDLIEEYQERQHEIMEDSADRTSQFLGKEIIAATGRMDAQGAKLQEFCALHNILPTKIMFDNGGDGYLTEKDPDLERAITDCDVQLIPSSRQEVDIMNADPGRDGNHDIETLLGIGAISHDPTVDEMRKELWAAQAVKSTLQQEYLPKYPPLAEAIAAEELKKSELKDAVMSARNLLLSTADHLKALKIDLMEQLVHEKNELKVLGGNIVTMTQMLREFQIKQDLVEKLVTAQADVQVNREKTIPVVQTINPPSISSRPVNIKWPLFGSAIFIFSLSIGLAVCGISERIDDRVRGIESIRSITDLPVISEIPSVRSLPSLKTPDDPSSAPGFRESINRIRSALSLDRRSQNQGLCISVSSPDSGDGKSMIAAHLALSLSVTGARVLLVDADMRRPSIDRQLDEYNDRGFSLLLTGESGVGPVETIFNNLSFLSAGMIPPNPGELLHSQMLSVQIKIWKSSYDYIILDTPPILAFSDCTTVSYQCDKTLFVVREKATRKCLAIQALARLHMNKIPVIGVILNGVDERLVRDSAFQSYQDAAIAQL
jgi:succinoglycan biosynthesis transport protein ExoP